MNIWNIFTIFAKNRQTRGDETRRNEVFSSRKQRARTRIVTWSENIRL